MFEDDFSHMIKQDEEMHFYSCVADVLDAFKTHGTSHILQEVAKNPQLKQELSSCLMALDK